MFVRRRRLHEARSRQMECSGSSFIWCLPLTASCAPEQLHQVPNLDVFERTHGILDLARESPIDAVGDEPVELLDGVFPGERTGSEARKILNLTLDYLSVL